MEKRFDDKHENTENCSGKKYRLPAGTDRKKRKHLTGKPDAECVKKKNPYNMFHKKLRTV